MVGRRGNGAFQVLLGLFQVTFGKGKAAEPHQRLGVFSILI